MKKIFTVLLLVAISLSVASCDSLMDLKDKLFGGKEAKERVDKTRPTPYEVRVYSNAYDGFVNVRQAPTLKSTVLGKLKNGEEYLVQAGCLCEARVGELQAHARHAFLYHFLQDRYFRTGGAQRTEEFDLSYLVFCSDFHLMRFSV